MRQLRRPARTQGVRAPLKPMYAATSAMDFTHDLVDGREGGDPNPQVLPAERRLTDRLRCGDVTTP